MKAQKIILLADDDPDDVEVFRMMFERATLPHALYFVRDGQEAIDWLSGNGIYSDREKYPLPSHLILDLKLPIKTGFEILEWLRSQKAFAELPVIILSSSDASIDVKRAYQLGITTYFVKTPLLQEVMQYLRLSS